MKGRKPSHFFEEHPLSDLGIAVGATGILFAAAIFVGRAAVAHAETQAPSPAVPDIEVAIPITAVTEADLPLLKLGGNPDAKRLPDRGVRRSPKVRAERQAFVSEKAGQEEIDIPPPDVPLADAEDKPPPPDAELTKKVDTEVKPTADPAPEANVPEKGHADGVLGGTETDPLKARAVDLYRARIIAWFSRRFRVTGSGLPAAELLKYRVSATVHISADRKVASYSLSPCGQSAFDAAARAALESAKGDALPPPPDNYPDVVQSQISLTFVCKEGRCD